MKGNSLMFLFLQLVIIIGLILIGYNKHHGDFLSPSLICMYMYLISTLAALMASFLNGTDISFLSMIITSMFLISILLGNLFAERVYIKYGRHNFEKKTSEYTLNEEKQIPILGMVILLAIAVISLYLYYLQVYRFSVLHGNSFGISLMLKYYRLGINSGDSIQLSFWMTQSLQLCRFFSYIMFYILTNNILYRRKFSARYILYIAYVIIALIIYSLSSSRGGFINYISAYLIIYFIILAKKNEWNFSLILKTSLRYSILAMLLFFAIFTFLGNGTGKTAQSGGAVQQALLYVGGSIKSFSLYVSDFFFPNIMEGGLESFSGIYGILNRFGAGLSTNANLEFCSLGNGITTNVYTAVRRYMNDFGVFGAMIMGFLIGLFYGTMYKNVKKDQKSFSFRLLFYAASIYPLFYISIDEMFLRGIFSMNTIYMIIYFYLIWLIFIRKKFRVRVNK